MRIKPSKLNNVCDDAQLRQTYMCSMLFETESRCRMSQANPHRTTKQLSSTNLIFFRREETIEHNFMPSHLLDLLPLRWQRASNYELAHFVELPLSLILSVVCFPSSTIYNVVMVENFSSATINFSFVTSSAPHRRAFFLYYVIPLWELYSGLLNGVRFINFAASYRRHDVR